MKRVQLALLACVACTADREGEGADSVIPPDSLGATESSATSDGPGSNTHPSDTSDSNASDSSNVPKYDVAYDGGDFCVGREAGIHCDGIEAVECGDDEDVVDRDDCAPDLCVDGIGCTVCSEGQYGCCGDQVMLCDTSTSPHSWQSMATCDAGAGQACSVATGSCVSSPIIGTTEPSGVYYQYASFMQGEVFLGGYDVDTYENLIYVTGASSGMVDVYEVELLDTDGDGMMEPNQHPDNPDEPGAIEERVLTFVESFTMSGLSMSSSELFALDDRIYRGGQNLTERVLATGVETIVSPVPAYMYYFSQIGRDQLRGVWYASNESYRRVHQYCEQSSTWGIAFDYPSLAGDHMDGIEIVVDPATDISYVYVSDMTSDFLGQYRWDPDTGWVQENLFSYQGTAGSLVEGMGFGALGHFWATGGSELYEIGGGDLGQYTDPAG